MAIQIGTHSEHKHRTDVKLGVGLILSSNENYLGKILHIHAIKIFGRQKF